MSACLATCHRSWLSSSTSSSRCSCKLVSGAGAVAASNRSVCKSGIAIGLLRQACLNGYAGRFYNAQALFDELYASLADRSTTRLLKALSRMRPIVIDELGYLTLKPEQVNAFFRLMDQRYARVSTIITTNLDYPDWYDLFANKPLVDALLDRLRHHCITIRIDGPSLREPAPPTASESPAEASALKPVLTRASRSARKLA